MAAAATADKTPAAATPAVGTPAATAPAAGGAPAAASAGASATAAAKAAAPPPVPAGVPPNRPGEPPFLLKLEPEAKIVFKGDKLAEEVTTVEMKLTNITDVRQTFKIKCTSNEIFRVRPPLGFCNAGETATVKIVFSSKTVPQNCRHFFAFYHMKNDEKDKTARQVWTPQSKPEGVRRLLVYFEKNDGTPAATPAAPAAAGVSAPASGNAAPAPAGKPAPTTGAGTTPPGGAASAGGVTPAGGAAPSGAAAPNGGAAPATGATAPAK